MAKKQEKSGESRGVRDEEYRAIAWLVIGVLTTAFWWSVLSWLLS